MVLSMKQIKLLLLFFHSLNSEFKGIKNLLEKIEFYNENDHILEEKDQSDGALVRPMRSREGNRPIRWHSGKTNEIT